MSDNLLQKAARIKLLVLDVDGVLTNGSVYTDGRGTEFKGFNIKDGHGLKLAQRAGLGLVWLSGRPSAATTGRADELGINEVHQGVHFKLPKFREILAQHGLSPAQAAFMGDDLIDIPPMREAGLALAPVDAVFEVRQVADWVATLPGGHGAVRQALELIMRANGTWQQATARYFENQ